MGLQIPLGLATSGPFMNPAFAFSWFFHLRGDTLWEHIAVYWLGCLAGSYLAGLAWWLFTTPAVVNPPPSPIPACLHGDDRQTFQVSCAIKRSP